jgi:hypothetical protein
MQPLICFAPNRHLRAGEVGALGRTFSREPMPINYRSMTLRQIASDLDETLCDLLVNAGERHLAPLVEQLGALNIPDNQRPSDRLIELMESLYQHDANLLDPRAQDLMKAATDEISRSVA